MESTDTTEIKRLLDEAERRRREKLEEEQEEYQFARDQMLTEDQRLGLFMYELAGYKVRLFSDTERFELKGLYSRKLFSELRPGTVMRHIKKVSYDKGCIAGANKVRSEVKNITDAVQRYYEDFIDEED